MLVLSRKHGESIVVDGTITITIVDIGRGRVQLGVDAPKHMPVHRQEVERRVRDQAAIPRLSPTVSL